ncbi:hypothetical protein QFZ79_003250 [Arthrobacter sp. V4I6]|nr:hypothetical protein [Arthrobacter sp. V4I6]
MRAVQPEAGHNLDTGCELRLELGLLLLRLLVAAEHHEDEKSEHDEQENRHDVDAAAGLRLGLGRN